MGPIALAAGLFLKIVARQAVGRAFGATAAGYFYGRDLTENHRRNRRERLRSQAPAATLPPGHVERKSR